MKIRTNRVLGWLAVSLIALASPAYADHHEKSEKGAAAEPSAEARAKMADAHQKMAECLRSTRPIQECRAEMKKAHGGMHGGEACSKDHHGDASTPSGAQGHAHGSKDPAKAPSTSGPAN